MAGTHETSKRSRRLVTYGKASRLGARATQNIISPRHAHLSSTESATGSGAFSQKYATPHLASDAPEIVSPQDVHYHSSASSENGRHADEDRNKQKKSASSGPGQRTHNPSRKSLNGPLHISAIGLGSREIDDTPSLDNLREKSSARGAEPKNRSSLIPEICDSSLKRSNSSLSLIEDYSRSPVVSMGLGNIKGTETEQLTSDSLSPDTSSTRRARKVLAHPKKKQLITEPSERLLSDENPRRQIGGVSYPSDLTSKNTSTSNSKQEDKLNLLGLDTPGRKRIVDSLSVQEGRGRYPLELPGIDDNSKTISSKDSFMSPGPSSHSGEITPTRPSVRLTSSLSSGSKVTYARQRSFLSEAGASDDGHGDLSRLLQTPQLQSQPQSDSATTISSFVDDEESTRVNSVRSIHELRRAGGSAHFQGTVNSMLEDIGDGSISISSRRSALIQLCRRLSDRQFSLRFLEHGFDRQFAGSISDQLDITCSYLAFCAYGLILSNGPPHSDVLLLFWPQVLRLSPDLLKLEDDILVISRQKHFGLPKDEQTAIHDLCSHFRTVFPTNQLQSWFSPQILGLRCIWVTMRECRDRIGAMKRIPNSLLEKIVELLVRYSTQPREISSPERLSILEYTLSILEAYTVSPAVFEDDHENPIKAVCYLGNLLHSLNELHDHRMKEIQVLYIRLVLNITNNNTSLCEDFSTPELVRSLTEIVLNDFERVSEMLSTERKETLDTVILALGTLINLTEETATPRKLILGEMTQSGSLLDRLLSLYSRSFEAVSEVRHLYMSLLQI